MPRGVKKKEVPPEARILEIVLKTLDDGKAEDVATIDLRGKSSIANEMVVASGTSQRHIMALAEQVYLNLKAEGFKSSLEGEIRGEWVLIDAYDVIVHLFKPEIRELYSLEKMWSGIKPRSAGD